MSHRGIYQKGQFIVGAAHSAAIAAGCPRYGQPSRPRPKAASLDEISDRIAEATRKLAELREVVKRK
jgi:hypothetical protein